MANHRPIPLAPAFAFEAIESVAELAEADGIPVEVQFNPEHIQDLGKRAINELVQSKGMRPLMAHTIIWYALGQLVDNTH